MNNIIARKNRVIRTLCEIAGVSPQAYYQSQKKEITVHYLEQLIVELVTELRSLNKRLGTRKIYPTVKQFALNNGMKLGRDAFFTLLERNQMLLRKRKKGSITTMSKHRYKKYPNIIKGLIPNQKNQIWVSDITYVHLNGGFYYLSLVTDMYSRKILGYYLCNNLSAHGPIMALTKALKNTGLKDLTGLIHHSDRGVQYCCDKYIALLKKHKVRISMTMKGDPLENPIAERVNGIIKTEYNLEKSTSFTQLSNLLEKSVFHYNNYRPHLSINKLVPSEAHNLNGYIPRLWKHKDFSKEKQYST